MFKLKVFSWKFVYLPEIVTISIIKTYQNLLETTEPMFQNGTIFSKDSPRNTVTIEVF